jgi:hypothetical protein
MILKNIFAKKFSEKIGGFVRNAVRLCKVGIVTLDFKKKAIFSPKIITKIAEICGHNIDPSALSMRIP